MKPIQNPTRSHITKTIHPWIGNALTVGVDRLLLGQEPIGNRISKEKALGFPQYQFICESLKMIAAIYGSCGLLNDMSS